MTGARPSFGPEAGGNGRPRPLLVALDRLFDEPADATAERRFLEGAAVFSCEAAPLAWIEAAAGFARGDAEMASALTNLIDLELIVVNGATASMAPLVHQRLRRLIDQGRWRATSRRAAVHVASWLQDTVDPKRMAEIDERMHHLDEALVAAERSESVPEEIAIATSLASHFRNRARYAEALALFSRALTKAEQLDPQEPDQVARALANQAAVLRDLGDLEGALKLLQRALAIEEAAHGPDHPRVAVSLSNLAAVSRDSGQPIAAVPLLRRAVAIEEATYGPDHPITATRLSNLGLVLQDLGQGADARPLFKRALAIEEATYGPNHPMIAVGLSNLAGALVHLGRPARDARALLERAFAIAASRLPPAHPWRTVIAANLAALDPVSVPPPLPTRESNREEPLTRTNPIRR